jgi:hypothetical protein
LLRLQKLSPPNGSLTHKRATKVAGLLINFNAGQLPKDARHDCNMIAIVSAFFVMT